MNISFPDRGGAVAAVASSLAADIVLSAGADVRDLRKAARDVADQAFARAALYDEDGAYPAADVAALAERGLLTATLPRELGGDGIRPLALSELLRQIGAGSLPLGRLFEGHVNALGLVLRYGDEEQARVVADEARAGKLFGVWNTDDKEGLHLLADRGRRRLQGRKILASGAGFIERPLVTATDEMGRRLMVIPRLQPGRRSDLSSWTAHGMRASATGAVDFSGLAVEETEIVGGDGDYERQPAFSGGAWRFAAVHLGGMEKLFDLLREHLRRTGRGGDPHQAARLGQAAIASETARLWVERAAAIAEEAPEARPAEQIVAYVNLARLAVERAGLDLMELVHRSAGLQGFHAAPSHRTHLAGSRDLPAPAGARPGVDQRGRLGAAPGNAFDRPLEGRMTAGELLERAHSFPVSSLKQRLGEGGVVVVAPHPDDESLGCGGLIAEAQAEGRRVRVVVVSDGTGSHPASKAYPKARLRDLRETEARRAVRELGLDSDKDIEFLRLPDRFVPSDGPFAEKAIERIIASAREVRAAALFVSWRHDAHCDHQASYRLARAAQRRLTAVKLFEYTIWGTALPAETPVELAGGFRLEIGRHLPRKRRAIDAHRSQTTDLIADDPNGFRLTGTDLARFALVYESFFESA